MDRAIMQDLRKWKDKPRRKPLLLTGVRQCGKTYIVNEFAKECFERDPQNWKMHFSGWKMQDSLQK